MNTSVWPSSSGSPDAQGRAAGVTRGSTRVRKYSSGMGPPLTRRPDGGVGPGSRRPPRRRADDTRATRQGATLWPDDVEIFLGSFLGVRELRPGRRLL